MAPASRSSLSLIPPDSTQTHGTPARLAACTSHTVSPTNTASSAAARLVQRGLHDVGVGLGSVDVGLRRDDVDHVVGVERRGEVLGLRLGCTGRQYDGQARLLRHAQQVGGTREGDKLVLPLTVEVTVRVGDLVVVAVQDRRDELVAALADRAMQTLIGTSCPCDRNACHQATTCR